MLASIKQKYCVYLSKRTRREIGVYFQKIQHEKQGICIIQYDDFKDTSVVHTIENIRIKLHYIVFYDSSKKLVFENTNEVTYISKKQFRFFRIVSKLFTKHPFNKTYDMLIDCTNSEEDYHHNYVVAVLKSKFKIGIYKESRSFLHDFCIKIGNANNIHKFVSNILTYLS